MRFFISILLATLFLGTTSAGRSLAYPRPSDLPTGTLARGEIDPVPGGDLYVGVLDEIIPPGSWTTVGGPPAFLLNGDEKLSVEGAPGVGELEAGKATFLQGGKQFRLNNPGETPARFRFVGLGAKGEVVGAHYEMEPVPWGPGSGKSYYVTLDRSRFPGNSATPWHYHTGPAFGILDDGAAWENRQVDGSTRRIPTPGYYTQPAMEVHQLAQVGTGGYALIFQFAPTGQPLTGGGPARNDATPTVLAQATAIPATDGKPLGTPTASPPTVQPDVTASPTVAPTSQRTDAPPDQANWGVFAAVGAILLLGGVGFLWVRRR